MTSNLEKLRLIPVNKTVVFYSPIEGKDVLVRTGIIDDENSFLHSIVHAYSKEYISMNDDGKKEFVNTLRESLSKDLDKKKWETISGNMIVKIPFQENVSNMLDGIYYFLKYGKTRTKNIRNIIIYKFAIFSIYICFVCFFIFNLFSPFFMVIIIT